MKAKRVLMAGIAALALALAQAAYADPSGGGIVIDDLAKLQTSLAAQPANTAAAPYTVVLPAFTLSEDDGERSDWGKVNTAVWEGKRYVILDLGNCAFRNNTVAGSFDVNKGMNIIMYNSYIKGIVLPHGLAGIGDGAFYNCTALTGVSIPSSVTIIGDGAFSGCTALTGVTIPSSVTIIGDSAFSGSTALTGVSIPSSVTIIGDSAFSGCTALIGVTIPANVTIIGDSAFSGCTALAGITVEDANRAYSSEDGVLFDKAKTTLIKYPAL
jgi:hypothetical protein